MRQTLLLFLGIFFVGTLFANEPASAIYLKLQKLHSLKRVLYVAAHPDDENTRALAYFSLGEKAETAYFSLTRGDGGQNLIGNELGDALGVLRTQELLGARSYDKARQYFSHAVDFGYSRSAEESFDLWGKEVLLADLVQMIRRFQPDVIITRFPPDERAGHGHHTASALLAIEALDKAADPNFLPEQVKQFGAWKAKAVYWNTSQWWDESINESTKDDPNYVLTDIGGYNAYLGMSYNEIGTLARSQHKCQGFGGIIERGTRVEYFKHLAGELFEDSFFEGKQRSWKEVAGAEIESMFANLMDGFNFDDPAQNVSALMDILARLEAMPASTLRDEKVTYCREIIQDCLGLYTELVGDDYSFVIGDSLALRLNVINRSSKKLTLKEISLTNGQVIPYNEVLNTSVELSKALKIVVNTTPSTPFWLEKPNTNLFQIDAGKDPLLAENPPTLGAKIVLDIDGRLFQYTIGADYKWRDPAYGERRRPLVAAPEYTATFEEEIALAQPNQRKVIQVKIHSFKKNLEDQLNIKVPAGWTVEGDNQVISIAAAHGETTLSFTLIAGSNASRGTLKLQNKAGKDLLNYKEITYDHIPTQTLFAPATMQCILLDAKIVPGKIAYINGVDDGLPKAIRQLGYEVDVFEVSDLAKLDLSVYRSVVLGIRIYNVHEELKNFNDRLFAYVHEGGNLIMQYNTAPRSSDGIKFGPLPFELSNERVTEENAEVKFLAPKHPIMNKPNKITQEDFKDWVQERGLYFAVKWDEGYVPLFSWADKGKDAVEGALIVAPYGKGQFVYTGISFFRELPAGVVGAYRLFANLLSFEP